MAGKDTAARSECCYVRDALVFERCFACVLFPGLCVVLIALLGGVDAEAKGYASMAGKDMYARSECCYVLH